ncbi:hypothetical protein GHT09_001569 [Marmota monax]|uniref:Uncharacterized protein n=1 Tax=Marmota monax TaxID=9995 RepID=A0A834Q1H0_MARMO|nr:hypothetical protein GHT09_001569 [Marmota monax]
MGEGRAQGGGARHSLLGGQATLSPHSSAPTGILTPPVPGLAVGKWALGVESSPSARVLTRPACALATPRSGACWPVPWGDLHQVARSVVNVYRSCWACKAPHPVMCPVAPLEGPQERRALEEGVGTSLFLPRTTPVGPLPEVPGRPWPAPPTCYFLASTFSPGTLATRRGVGTAATTPGCRVSVLEGTKAAEVPSSEGPTQLLYVDPTIPRPLWALGSETKQTSAPLTPSSMAWAPSWELAFLPTALHPQCPIGGKWGQEWGIVGPSWRPSTHHPGEGPGGPGAQGFPSLAEGPHWGSFLLGSGSSGEAEPSLPCEAGVGEIVHASVRRVCACA